MSGRQWRGLAARRLLEVTGQPDPERAMQMLSAQLINEAGLTFPPVDLTMLASYRDVIAIDKCPMVSAGRLVPTDDGHLRIEVNTNHILQKRNFTIAHEICHTMIPTYVNQLIDDARTGSYPESAGPEWEEEYLCDVGAAALLMDSRFVRTLINNRPMSIDLLIACANKFQASVHAMARQVAAISENPIAFILWERDSLVRAFCVSSFYRSATFPINIAIPRRAVCAEESPVDEAWASRHRKPIRETYAFRFNPTVGPYRLYSESVSAPYGKVARVVTFLRPPRDA